MPVPLAQCLAEAPGTAALVLHQDRAALPPGERGLRLLAGRTAKLGRTLGICSQPGELTGCHGPSLGFLPSSVFWVLVMAWPYPRMSVDAAELAQGGPGVRLQQGWNDVQGRVLSMCCINKEESPLCIMHPHLCLQPLYVL